MNDTFDHYRNLVLDWARARQIIPNGKAHVQLMKTGAELGELLDAEIKSDRPGIVDGIGDVLVTLIIYAELMGLEWPEYSDLIPEDTTNLELMDAASMYGQLLSAHLDYATSYRRHSYIQESLSVMVNAIASYASMHDLIPSYCLASSYNEIKDRTGTMMPNGLFVKDEA